MVQHDLHWGGEFRDSGRRMHCVLLIIIVCYEVMKLNSVFPTEAGYVDGAWRQGVPGSGRLFCSIEMIDQEPVGSYTDWGSPFQKEKYSAWLESNGMSALLSTTDGHFRADQGISKDTVTKYDLAYRAGADRSTDIGMFHTDGTPEDINGTAPPSSTYWLSAGELPGGALATTVFAQGEFRGIFLPFGRLLESMLVDVQAINKETWQAPQDTLVCSRPEVVHKAPTTRFYYPNWFLRICTTVNRPD